MVSLVNLCPTMLKYIGIPMHMETRRQLIHLSGLLLVLAAQATGGRFVATYCFLIAMSFLMYSHYVRGAEKRMKRIEKMYDGLEENFRKLATGFERKGVRPFRGAFWLFMGMGIAFALFPLPVASAAGAILAVGDSFSTLVGRKFGKHRITEHKSVEGTVAFFLSSVLVSSVFIGWGAALVGSLAAALAELVPKLPNRHIAALEKKGALDDNWLIPVAAGVAMMIICLVLPCYGLLGFCEK